MHEPTLANPAVLRPSTGNVAGANVDSAGLLGLCLAGLCAFLSVYASQPLLPTLERAFDVGKAGAALTVSAPSTAVALASPLSGYLADRWGQRRIMLASLFLLVVPTALAATATSMPWLIFWRFCQGLAVPGIYAVGIAYAANRFPSRDLGHAMASLITGNVLGGFLGRTLSGQIAALAGWRYAFLALALLTGVGAVLTWRLLPDERGRVSSHSGTPRTSARDLLRPEVLATFGIGFSLLFVQVAVFTYVTFYLAAPPFELGPSALGAIFAIYLIGAVVTPRAGRLIDRIGSLRGLSLAVALGLAGPVLTLVPRLGWVVAGLACSATATFVGQSAATSYLSQVVPPTLRARASGFYLSCYYVGGAVGGVAPALIWSWGGWSSCVALVVAIELISLVVIRCAKDPAIMARRNAPQAVPPLGCRAAARVS